MKRLTALLVFLEFVVIPGAIAQPTPLGTAITYQGRLDRNGQMATNGIYGMRFMLFDREATNANVIGSIIEQTVPITNGLFTMALDFGAGAFGGEARWLEVGVNTNTVSPTPGYLVLSPRTRLRPAPNAIYASTAGTVTNGAIQLPQLGASGTPLAGQVLGYNGISLSWQTAGVGPSPWLLSGANTYFSGGNVGIGTATPSAPFHVNSSASASSVLGALLEPNLSSGAFNQIYLGRSGTGNGCSTLTYTYNAANPASSVLSLGLYNSSYTLNVRGDGNVGIGTITPSSKLDVNGHAYFRGDLTIGTAETEAGLGAFLIYGHAPPIEQTPVRFVVRPNGNVGINTPSPVARLDIRGDWDGGHPALQLGGEKPTIRFAAEPASGSQEWLLHLGSDGPGDLQFLRRDAFIYAPILTLGADEKVGIGTANPLEKLHVNGDFIRVEGANGEAACLGSDSQGGEVHLGSMKSGVTTVALYNQADGAYMHLNMKSCTIYGGADVAEPFHITTPEISKGSVVIIDPANPGNLKLSTEAYDRRVAGIISGANDIHPGIALQQQGILEGGQNVALSGRVFVQADASNGAIEPGDLLTTSKLPGHAMKVTDHARSQGAILGKAMGALKEGTGLVLVLVTLQ